MKKVEAKLTEKLIEDLLQKGELQPVAKVCKEETGERPSHVTVWRWWNKGVAGGVKLATVPVMGKRMTTVAAFRDFLRRRAEADTKPSQTLPDASDDTLKALGID